MIKREGDGSLVTGINSGYPSSTASVTGKMGCEYDARQVGEKISVKPTISGGSCLHCFAHTKSDLKSLTESQVNEISHSKQGKSFKKNDVLIAQGGLVDHIFCIRAGLVRLDSVGNDGHSVTLGFLEGGDLVGLGPVLAKQSSHFSATVVEPTYACAVPANMLARMVKETPQIALDYATTLLKELKSTQNRLLSSVDKDVEGRVAEALIYFKSSFPDYQFTRKELGEWAGTTTESAIRTLGDFESRGLIKQSGRSVEIVEMPELQSLAGIFV
jgi:CRP-like cAMP-binding protein